MKLYIGCYTKKITEELVGKGQGIYVLDFNPANGSITYVDCIKTVNPSYLTLSPDGRFLFAVEENPIEDSPKIRSFSINESSRDRDLKLISEQDLPGSFACHLATSKSGKHLIVGAYMSGNVLIYPITSDGQIKKHIHNVVHEGKGHNEIRQEAPHVHFISPDEEDQFYAVDLGIDTVVSYKINQDSSITEQKEQNISIASGSGPRHMVVSPLGKHLFVFSELDSKIHVFKKVNKNFEFQESKQTLPIDFKGVPSGAAIKMHPNGKFIFVSNREYDGITVFHFDESSDKLSFFEQVPTDGKTPRDMNIDPTGEWLICANQDSDNLVVFKIDQDSGQLSNVHKNEEIKTPCCVLFGK